MLYRFLLLTLATALAAGCSPNETPQTGVMRLAAPEAVKAAKTTEAPHPARNYHYSPFVVHVHGSSDFDTITFKDVGMVRTDFTPNDPKLETLAEAVSMELSVSQPNLHTQVGYDVSLLDPANHKSCDLRHVYIDVWQSAESKWGYSLWSGCGADDNFAWEQLNTPVDPNADLVNQISPLARALASRISKASQTSCFQKNC